MNKSYKEMDIDWNKLEYILKGRIPEDLTDDEIEFFTKKYFGIGLARTGTRSLFLAMYKLGFKTSHGINHIDSVHKNQFCDDVSVAHRYKFLDYAFPEAKFILTIRDLDSWLVSCGNHAGRKGGEFSPHISLVAEKLTRSEQRFNIFGITHFDEDIYRAKYYEYHNGIYKHFEGREDKLFTMNIINGDGWDMLCPFVDKMVPPEPFPHENKSKRG